MDQRRCPTIGILTPQTGGFYYGAILEGIQRAAGRLGALVVAIQTSEMELYWPSEPGEQSLGLNSIDGWLAIQGFNAPGFIKRLRRAQRPIVHINEKPEIESGSAVLPDNAEGTKAAVLHLIEHGHTRIAFAGHLAQHDLKERHAGFLAAHKESGLAVDTTLLFETDGCLERDGYLIGQHLGQEGLPCTAMVASTDKLALGLLNALSGFGLKAPKDLAIVGFDDIEKAQYANPPLTTVKQSFTQLASLATESLVRHIQTGSPLPRIQRVASKFVPRKSCGCALSHSVLPPMMLPKALPSADALNQRLLLLAGGGQQPLPQEQWPEARQISTLLFQLTHPSDGGTPRALIGEWVGFLNVCRDVEGIEKAITLLEETTRAWCPELDGNQTAKAALRDLRIELMRTWRTMEHQRSRSFDSVVEAREKIGQSLSNTATGYATDLCWLQWSRARHAYLTLWNPPQSAGPRELQVVNEYCITPYCPPIGTSTFRARSFPTQEMLQTLKELGPGNTLTVVPVTGGHANRGLLAIVCPVEADLVVYAGEWGAQIGASLEREEGERSLRNSARHDELTGLPNRVLLMECLEGLRDDPSHDDFALLFLDLDDFKKVNDSLGHNAGDELLIQSAKRLKNALDTAGTIARLGGDEFAVVIPNVDDRKEVIRIVSTLHEALDAPFHLDGDQIFTSCSIGIAFSERNFIAPELLRDADTAMYRAKLQGRSCYEIFEGGMHAQAVERLKLDSRLRQALEQNEFELRYQPILSIRTGLPVGAEALIRWNHPQQGLLSPARFLAVAEEAGLAVPISKWVLENACSEAKKWQSLGPENLYVNINIPPQHLEDEGFVDLIKDTLRRHQLPAQCLGLELVESSLLEHRASASETISQLKQLGVKVAIDDFGTGYSSLSYLKSFPVAVLKIDRTFVQTLTTDQRDAAIVTAIITMGHGLGLKIVAEGVETQAQLDFLRAQGCDLVQGYLLSRPIAGSECRRFLAEPTIRASLAPGSRRARPPPQELAV